MKSLCSALITILLVFSLSACSAPPTAAVDSKPRTLDESKFVDLTHPFDADTIYWPNAQRFHWEKESWGKSPAGYWYTAARYSASEHGGTHLDSPIHFGEGRETVDQLPLSKLIGPVLVIDVTAACSSNPDYLLSAADVTSWEKEHGQIEPAAIVLVRTGWDKYWPNKKKYLGSDVPGDISNLHFPGVSREAAEILRERKVDAIGIDTASIDFGASKDFIVHQMLNGAGIYGLENLSKLDTLPARGATIMSFPMKIKGGTGAPTRVVALLP
jgi:kynurenine formamidase